MVEIINTPIAEPTAVEDYVRDEDTRPDTVKIQRQRRCLPDHDRSQPGFPGPGHLPGDQGGRPQLGERPDAGDQQPARNKQEPGFYTYGKRVR